MDEFRGEGLRAIVTGSSGGIGGAICAALIESGGVVVGIDRAPGDGTSSRCGARFHHVDCDLARPDGIDAAFARADDLLGASPTLLVNCAATFYHGNVLQMQVEDIDRLLAVNVRAYILCAQQAGRRMAPAGGGRIINISSTAAEMGWRDEAVYCATKGAVKALTRGLAIDLAPYRIAVNAVSPGSIDTAGVSPEMRIGESVEHDILRTPYGRWGRPEEIAQTVRFLALDAGFITGQTITVDGGFTSTGLNYFGTLKAPALPGGHAQS